MYTETVSEIIKALAYGVAPEKIAQTAGVDLSEVEAVAQSWPDEIAARRARIREDGFDG